MDSGSNSAGYFSVDENDQMFDEALEQLEQNDDSGTENESDEWLI